MDGFQRRRELKKKSILQAAFDLFSRYGVQKVTVAEIAKKANVSQVSIYNYFGSKNNLVKYSVMQMMDDVAKTFRPLLDSDLPFPEKMHKLIFEKTEISKMMGEKGFFQAVSIQDPEIQKFLEDYAQTKAMPAMMALLDQGRAEGYVNPDISTESILYYIGIIQQATQNPDFFRDENQKVRLDLATLFFYGLAGKPQTR